MHKYIPVYLSGKYTQTVRDFFLFAFFLLFWTTKGYESVFIFSTNVDFSMALVKIFFSFKLMSLQVQ